MYSANDYRFLKQENTTYPEFYIYDENGRLQGIAQPVNLTYSDGSTITVMYPVTQYIWGPDRVLVKIDALTGNSYYYLYNGHGDVVQIVDTAGNIVNSYDYDVWGNFITKEETIDNHFTYFGQTYDETTGLYYLRARYYDPTTGRFTQQDPAEDGYNWYVYGNNNPVMYVDPSGEAAWGYGVTLYAAFGIRIDVQAYYVRDSKGNKGIIIVGGGGGGTPNAGASGAYFYNSSAKSIYALEGMSVSVGGSAGYVGGDANGDLRGGTISAGVSAIPAELHGTVTFGKILYSWK